MVKTYLSYLSVLTEDVTGEEVTMIQAWNCWMKLKSVPNAVKLNRLLMECTDLISDVLKDVKT